VIIFTFHGMNKSMEGSSSCSMAHYLSLTNSGRYWPLHGSQILSHSTFNNFWQSYGGGILKVRKRSPLYRHWGSVHAVRPTGGVEV